MQMFSAHVRGGVIVPDDGVSLPEGTTVTVLFGDATEPFDLTPEEEAELAESIREGDAGQVITAEELLERLRR
jgi:hypothetical protein